MGNNLIGLGLKAYWQFGREATWATAPTINRRLGLEAASIGPSVGIAEDPNMPAAAGAGSSQAWTDAEIYAVGEKAEGTIGGVLDYEGQLQLLDMIYGTDTYGSYGATVSGTNPYTHVFTDREFLNSVTSELVEGNIPAGKCVQILGQKLRSLVLSGNAAMGAAGMVRWKAEVVGQKALSNATPTGALSQVARIPVLFGHCTTMTDGSADAASLVKVTGFELTLRPAVADGRLYLGTGNFIDEPLRAGKVKCQLRLKRMFTSRSLFDLYKANTSAALQIVFADGNGRSITIDLARAKLVEQPKHDINADGFMEEDALWQATWSTFASKITVINTQASAAA